MRGVRVRPGVEVGGDHLFAAGARLGERRAHAALEGELHVRERELRQVVERHLDLAGDRIEVDLAGDLDPQVAFGFLDHEVHREEVVVGVVSLFRDVDVTAHRFVARQDRRVQGQLPVLRVVGAGTGLLSRARAATEVQTPRPCAAEVEIVIPLGRW